MSIPFLRKLQALQYPDIPSLLHASSSSSSSPFSSFNSPSFRTLVAWLELTKIRFWPVEQRDPIKNVTHAQWNQVFHTYLTQLDCPRPFDEAESLSVESVHLIVDWLLNQAIGAEFADHAGEFNSLSKMWFIKQDQQQSSSHSSSTPIALESSSVLSAEFESEISKLSELFQLPFDSQQKATMIRVIRKRIEESNVMAMAGNTDSSKNQASTPAAAVAQKGRGGISSAAAASASSSSSSAAAAPASRPRRTPRAKELDPLPTTREGVFAALDQIEKGFPSTGDASVDYAAQVFRLLFLHDLRNAQNLANELMMLAQEYTSDPKTDAKLGKVGI